MILIIKLPKEETLSTQVSSCIFWFQIYNSLQTFKLLCRNFLGRYSISSLYLPPNIRSDLPLSDHSEIKQLISEQLHKYFQEYTKYKQTCEIENN